MIKSLKFFRSLFCMKYKLFIIHQIKNVFRDDFEDQEKSQPEPLVTFPDPESPPPISTSAITQVTASQVYSFNPRNNFNHSNTTINSTNKHGLSKYPITSDSVKFEQKKLSTASKKKVIIISVISKKIVFNIYVNYKKKKIASYL